MASCAECGSRVGKGGYGGFCSRRCAGAVGGRAAAKVHKKPHPPKECPICGVLFGEDMAPSTLADMQFCSVACSRDHHAKKREASRIPCQICGKKFPGGKKTCSKECGRRLQSATMTVDTPEKECEACGKMFGRSAGERPNKWYERRYCGLECGRTVGRTASARKLSEMVAQGRECKRCGAQMRPRDGEKPNKFAARTTCAGAGGCTVDVLGVRLTAAELAEAVGVAESTIKQRLARGGGLRSALARRHAQPSKRAAYKCGGHNAKTCDRPPPIKT